MLVVGTVCVVFEMVVVQSIVTTSVMQLVSYDGDPSYKIVVAML